MVYTLTLSPSIDYTVHIEDANLTSGTVLRSSFETMTPGGKGLNVSTVLSNLGIPNIALGIVGGKIGEIIEQQMKSRGITTDFLKIADESRINIKIPGAQETAINACGPLIPSSVIEALKEKVAFLTSDDWLVMSGSVPSTVNDDIYNTFGAIAKERGARIVIDTSGSAFKESLKNRPFLIKPNFDELQHYHGDKIENDEVLERVCRNILKGGVQNVLLSLGAKGAKLYHDDGEVLHVTAPTIEDSGNTVGAGDAMLAAFIAIYIKTNDFFQALMWSVASGSALVKNHGALPSAVDIERVLHNIDKF